MKNGAAMSESSQAGPQYVDRDTAIITQQVHSQEFSQGNREDSSHKSSYTAAGSGAIHNSQKGKRPRCPSTNEWRSKRWSSLTREYYSAMKKEQTSDTGHNTDEPQKRDAEGKEPGMEATCHGIPRT